jgi:hypothetical protein
MELVLVKRFALREDLPSDDAIGVDISCGTIGLARENLEGEKEEDEQEEEKEKGKEEEG